MNWYLKTSNNDKPHIAKWWIENHNGEIVVDEGLQSNEVGGLTDAQLLASAPKLLEALKVCYKSLCTYGSHPIIEKQVENAFASVEGRTA